MKQRTKVLKGAASKLLAVAAGFAIFMPALVPSASQADAATAEKFSPMCGRRLICRE